MNRKEFQDQIDVGDIITAPYDSLYEFLGYNECPWMYIIDTCRKCKGYFILKRLHDEKILDGKNCYTKNGNVKFYLYEKKIYEEFITEEEFSV